ncbi:sulfotransferase [Novosphingobium sp.]|uniref:sulfotransferase n=1 Tax=Novosphingobium sp. TaxID=1874826 RepID=UPI003B52CCF1
MSSPAASSSPDSAGARSSNPGSASTYRGIDRLLHRIALGIPAVLDLSFDLEKGRFGKAAAAQTLRPPVFVTGLARAGTTILMQKIHGADRFASLRYRDMPFPLAPNSWAALTEKRRRAIPAHERGHGDGLTHDLDSPEAIEEVFWKLREGDQYLSATGMRAHAPAPATLEDFAMLMRLVCLRYGGDRYLSKNNANILRLRALAQTATDAVLIHPFRAPLEQAASLLMQHRRAVALGRTDAFRASFMRWLGHHEFGVDQRAILLPPGSGPVGNPDTLAFWLRTWTGVHTHLLVQPADVAAMQCFVDYDRLVTGDLRLRERLAQRLGLAEPLAGDGLRPPAPHGIDAADVPRAELAEAQAIHARLLARAAV